MKEKDHILKKAVEDTKQTLIPNGPSKDLVDATIKELNQVASELPEEQYEEQVASTKRLIINNVFRMAAAVILSISIGYAAGRISSPKPLDMEQIRSELEPAIREKLFEDVQLGLTNNYVQIKQELTEQYFQDLRLVALQVLNASGKITNQLVEEHIQPIATAQFQDRQWITAELNQNRQNVAVIAKFLTSTDIDSTNPNELDNQNNYNQGENYENLIQNN
ncbi:MAG: hypothetical protein JXA96_02580 [Sedimentisphaerales bacterium]|nr:hypothetical protein [Sedimentisphaerales bacterium]